MLPDMEKGLCRCNYVPDFGIGGSLHPGIIQVGPQRMLKSQEKREAGDLTLDQREGRRRVGHRGRVWREVAINQGLPVPPGAGGGQVQVLPSTLQRECGSPHTLMLAP